MVSPIDPTWMRPLGATGLSVSALCLGGAPLGSMPENFGYSVSERDAIEVVRAVLASPVRFLDTANGYSDGESERRIGAGITAAGGLPEGFVVATKVDARDGDYSSARVRASVAESRQRLGLDHLPLVHLHDPEFHDWEVLTAPGGAVETLTAMRQGGEIGHIGLAGGTVPLMSRYLRLGVFDVLLVHNRWTLVDRSADALIDDARARGMGVVNAAVYGGGLLARSTDDGPPFYGYRPAHRATVEAVHRLRELCARHQTTLATAALQFSLRDPRVDSTIVGFSRTARLGEALTSAATVLPPEFWAEVERLVPPPDAWLDPLGAETCDQEAATA